MENTWPRGVRHAMTQDEHRAWNATYYPGTRQLCSRCGEPTGRCEEDQIIDSASREPVCEECAYELDLI